MTTNGLAIRGRVTLVAAVLCVAGCVAETPPIPLPDLTAVEPPVARAVEAARSEVQAAPRSAAAWGALGERLRAHQWLVEAAESYRRAAELEPDNFRWSYLVGYCRAFDDPAAAAEAFERAVAIDADYAPARLSYADVLARLGKEEEARGQFEAAERLDPTGSHALLGLGRLAVSAGRFEEGRDHLERALRRDRSHGDVHLALAQVYLALGDEDRARQHADAARDLPESAPMGDPRLASTVEPVGSYALNLRGTQLFSDGRLEEAEQFFRRALELNPRFEEAHMNLGVVRQRQGRFEEAESHFRFALEIDPGRAEILALLGDLLTRQEKPEEAIPHLLEALQIDPEDETSRFRLGQSLAALDRLDDAATHLRAVLQGNPRHPGAHYTLGEVLAEKGRLEEAAGHFREVLAIHRGDLARLSRLTGYLVLQRREAELRRHQERIQRKRAAVAEAHNALGGVLMRRAEFDAAAEQFREALGIRPDHPEAQANLVKALER